MLKFTLHTVLNPSCNNAYCKFVVLPFFFGGGAGGHGRMFNLQLKSACLSLPCAGMKDLCHTKLILIALWGWLSIFYFLSFRLLFAKTSKIVANILQEVLAPLFPLNSFILLGIRSGFQLQKPLLTDTVSSPTGLSPVESWVFIVRKAVRMLLSSVVYHWEDVKSITSDLIQCLLYVTQAG